MKQLLRLGLVAWILLPGALWAGSGTHVIFQAMEEEMTRSLQHLKVDVFGPPYFIQYQIRHHDHAEVVASFGALLDSRRDQKRTLFVDVKVGDVQFDSSHPDSHRYTAQSMIPLENDLDSLRRALWYETDLRYKQAIVNYLKKKGRFISGVESHDLPDFSQGNPPQHRVEPIPAWNPDLASWERLAKVLSARFKQEPGIEKSRVKIYSDRITRYHYDSEGNRLHDGSVFYALIIEGWTKSVEGTPLHDQETIYFKSPDEFPEKERLIQLVDRLMASLRQIKSAPKMAPYIGPAIFSPDATAVLFHEAIGHRLEGDRLREDRDGKTFLKQINKRILPPFITVLDNPVLDRFDDVPLLGHYRHDDEGQPSREVVLVDHGVLQNFLLTRMPVLEFNRTNGHARGDGLHAPMSRMSNFIVQSDFSLDAARLKQKLIEEVVRQNKPYGLFVKKIVGGETMTQNGQFQVFKGKPLYLYKVYPDGREELMRGVDFVGTPLSMINKILVTGDDTAVINGFCTAESGALPVTSITPSILLSEVELQVGHQSTVRPPILSPPEVSQKP